MEQWVKYKRLRNIAISEIRHLKQGYFNENQVNSDQTDCKKFWKNYQNTSWYWQKENQQLYQH